MSGCLIRPDIRPRHDGAKYVPHGFLVRSRYRHDAFRIAVFGDSKSERAAPKLRAIGLFVQALENQFDLIPRSLRGVQNLL